MECDQNTALVHGLKTLFNVGVVRDLTDGQLLERFATDRGEAAELAFAVLVERHGPMVLRVCRSVLDGNFESDDAFQATFLVLVMKARRLWVRDSLGPWLHQVAFRTASRARRAATCRRKHEQRAATARLEAHTVKSDDLDGLIHAEIEKLPERYRAPVVLCDLEGCSHQQAARHLGWPVGTVKSRQARGREKLRDRLRRHGVAPNLALLGAGRCFTAANPVVSPALVESTTRIVVQFVTCEPAVNASTLALAQEVLKAMSLTRWSTAACILLFIGATVSGAGFLARSGTPAAPRPPAANRESTSPDEPITFQVKPGALAFTLTERGTVESARNMDLFNNVKGSTTIIQLMPEGTRVKKGETVCILDSAPLRDQLTNALIAVKKAEVAYQNAKVARELAEFAVTEFREATSKQELGAANAEIALAESALGQSERRRDRTRRARQRLAEQPAAKNGIVAASDILAELDIEDRIDATEQSISREKAALERAKVKRETFERFTREKTLKALTLEVERARPEELAKLAISQLEQSTVTSLERQIASCELKAPTDGIVAYAHPPRATANRPAPDQIAEGAQVRERQKIVSIFEPEGPMQINAKVREATVHMVRRGMKAKIRVHALPESLFDGEVVEVSPNPDSRSSSTDAKVYTTKVMSKNGVRGMRPGMNTDVELLLANRENALAVPVQAILLLEQKPHVVVRKPGGDVELRAVTIGSSSDKLLEITKGLESGDDVILNPAAFLSDQPKTRVARPSTSSASSRVPPDRKP
jgi:HlyD family secretion protein